MPTKTLALTLGLAGCASAVAMPTDLGPAPTHTADHAAIARALGPAGLDALFARYDQMVEGPEKAAFARTIDKAAGQKYATVSRLYWYTDRAAAEAAAALQGKPILALRMLGRLDEDLSCANSRLFRATLYANRETADFMKDHFVLYWSSARDVPKMTIDFGDGRTLVTTTTGNSSHYVLSPDGAVLDVLPGMYAPRAFRAELAKSLALAQKVAKLAPDKRTAAVRAHHREEARVHEYRLARLPGLAGIAPIVTPQAAMQAQLRTMTKAAIEVRPIVQMLRLADVPSSDTTTWTALARAVWNLDDTKATPARRALPSTPEVELVYTDRPRPRPAWGTKPIPRVLDDASRQLVRQLHLAGPFETSEEEIARMLARLETNLIADSALGELRLRPQIHQMLAAGALAFEELDRQIYASVYKTPGDDPWMGLAPRTDFTGLPGDGATVAQKRPAMAQR